MNNKSTIFLFLDIDGVLVPLERVPRPIALDKGPPRPLNSDCVQRLIDTLDAFPAVQVVISSSWRLLLNIDELRAVFPAALAERIVAVTPEVSRPDRIREIRAFLESNNCAGFIALDDSGENFPDDIPCVTPIGTEGYDERCASELATYLREFSD